MSLRFKDIAKLRRKAGPLPTDWGKDTFEMSLMAWCASAGVGRRDMERVRKLLELFSWFKLAQSGLLSYRRRRNSPFSMTRAMVEARAKDFGIQWPGKSKDRTKEKRRQYRERIYGRKQESPTLWDRLAKWKKHGGPIVYRALREAGKGPSECHLIKKVAHQPSDFSTYIIVGRNFYKRFTVPNEREHLSFSERQSTTRKIFRLTANPLPLP